MASAPIGTPAEIEVWGVGLGSGLSDFQAYYVTDNYNIDNNFLNWLYNRYADKSVKIYLDKNCTIELQIGMDITDIFTYKGSNNQYEMYQTVLYFVLNNPNFIIKRGKQANLPTVKKSGTMYVTTDYPNIYIDISSSERISILPPYTAADEGKVLAIVDGKLTWVNQFDDFD